MDTVPPTAPAHKTWVALIRDLVRRRKWTYALFFGATAGTAVGVLNLAAAFHGWKLERLFDILDGPAFWLMDAVGMDDYVYAFDTLVAIICYWTLIGLFLGWLYCVIRRTGITGMAKAIANDGICRRVLFYGTFAGMLVGCLNFAAVANGWKLEDSFGALARPAIAAIETVRDQIIFRDDLPGGSGIGTLYFLAAVIISVYWTAIGFFLASVFCFIRIVRKKSGAMDARVSEGRLTKK